MTVLSALNKTNAIRTKIIDAVDIHQRANESVTTCYFYGNIANNCAELCARRARILAKAPRDFLVFNYFDEKFFNCSSAILFYAFYVHQLFIIGFHRHRRARIPRIKIKRIFSF